MVARAKPMPTTAAQSRRTAIDAEADDQAGDGLEQEQRPDGGDGAVAVGLAPQVEVDVGRPDQQEAADHEGGRRRQVDGPPGAARSAQQQVPAHLHTIHPEAHRVVDVGGDRGHGRDTGEGGVRDCAGAG